MAGCSGSCGSCGDSSCGERNAPQALKQHEGTKIGKIIAIASGKGGVGKSLTTALLACELNRRGKKVGVLDGDITGPSIPRSFGIHQAPELDEQGMILPAVTKTGIKLVSTNMLTADEATPFLWRGPVLNGVLTQFYSDINWGELDYLLIDMPPGTGDIPMTVFQQFPIAGAIVVSSPQVLVNMIVEKCIRMCKSMQVPVLGLVENMSYFQCPNCDEKHEIFGKSEVEYIASEKGIEAWARIPMVPEVTAKVDAGCAEDIENDWYAVIADKLETL